ncbi:uncharacterized protein SCODWIG_03813 [Saccharomycodes ludwigii]|uniref:Uncharacterized protein n=1 Tax=Saccharomycodes ludwigii TaxID=36035 RepID=A0A376BBT5_9ASCO|nr:hypothetical protein SCDLUD_004977 [Saccharomycodes ludwigii]KAH3898655.1 hypothetical protein SCDLUD_004977 [Saccharomycodes ludwigii]SSD62051.1 uncharacterized protein SCODWIG_03813 [Saccharomycodes ludwigii]
MSVLSRDPFVDAFRGLNVLEMETIESCDNPFFDHAKYDEMKLNYADTIFPCFSFINGMTLNPECKPVPIYKNLQLIGLGIAFNYIPSILYNEKLRFLGVLQRHGLSSIILNQLLNKIGFSQYPILITGTWLGVSILYADNKKQPFKSQIASAQQKIDYPIFKDRTYHKNFDPEGLLGSLMTSVTLWSGIWYARMKLDVNQSLMVGSSLLAGGKLLAFLSPNYFPVSKPLWTPSFTMISTGWSILKYSFLKMGISFLPKYVQSLLSIVGRQNMEVYFMGEILLLLLKYKQNKKSIWGYCYQKLGNYLPDWWVQFFLTSSFNMTLVLFAVFCNKYRLKIRFF